MAELRKNNHIDLLNTEIGDIDFGNITISIENIKKKLTNEETNKEKTKEEDDKNSKTR